MLTKITTGIIYLFCSISIWAQTDSLLPVSDSLNRYKFPDYIRIDSSVHKAYPFINFAKNNYQFYTEKSPNWEHLYHEIDTLIHQKDRKLNVYHLGGSHIQADIYSHDFRTFLQSNWPDLPGERGMVFPFDLAHTNNPANYEFSSPNQWKAYRSVIHRPDSIEYGVMGAVVICNDSLIQLYFKHDKTTVKPPFNHLRIYYNRGEIGYELNFGEDEILIDHVTSNPEKGYTDIYFTDTIDQLDLQFCRIEGTTAPLELYGFLFMNDFPGISYTSIGLNGAGLYTYRDNTYFEEQLATYPPDVFIFSVGTNDANVPYSNFEPKTYKHNLEILIKKVLEANPDCAILLTVPNDAFYHKKYLNRNIAREREVIVELAKEYQVPVWDLYGVMGELGSSRIWLRHGLMRSDLVHFTSEGYHLKGDLIIDGFLKFLEQMQKTEKLKK